MLKKLYIFVLLVFCLGCFSGCGLISKAKEAVNNVMQEKEDQVRINLLNNINANDHSKETEDVMSKYLRKKEKNDKLNNSFLAETPIIGSIIRGATAKSNDKAFESLKKTAEKDKVFQDSMKNGTGDVNSFLDKFIAGGGKIIILVVLLVLVLALLSKLKSNKKVDKIQEKIVKEQLKTAKAETRRINAEAKKLEKDNESKPEIVNRTYQKNAISDSSYIRMIRSNCEKAGIDLDELIEECGGNLEKAFQRSNIATISNEFNSHLDSDSGDIGGEFD